jgi:hypothetical protein
MPIYSETGDAQKAQKQGALEGAYGSLLHVMIFLQDPLHNLYIYIPPAEFDL